MKVLFDHPDPFLLMHGGFQIQIEQTRAALAAIGVDVDFLRWWDDSQRPDILHYFGRPRLNYVQFARSKGIKVVMSQLLTGLGSRAELPRKIQRVVIHACRRFLPEMLTAPFAWEAYRSVDASISLTPWEAHLMESIFEVPKSKLHVVANGVEEVFLNSKPVTRGPWLVCTATIAERKRVVELAETAVLAKTPLWIVGRAYSDTEPYAQRFHKIARANPEIIRYEGAIGDRAKIAEAYRQARGFVLLSTMESLSLSALEAAACEAPLLLSDLPWARTVFKEEAAYCPITSPARAAAVLRGFYENASSMRLPQRPAAWVEIASQIRGVYEQVLRS